jgi:H+/Cl- antiporter ClcA
LAGRLIIRYPVGFAALCGLLVAIIGSLSEGQAYGTGYAQARSMVKGHSILPGGLRAFEADGDSGLLVSGIPGSSSPPPYFSGVVQAPITSAVIIMEMTDNRT